MDFSNDYCSCDLVADIDDVDNQYDIPQQLKDMCKEAVKCELCGKDLKTVKHLVLKFEEYLKRKEQSGARGRSVGFPWKKTHSVPKEEELKEIKAFYLILKVIVELGSQEPVELIRKGIVYTGGRPEDILQDIKEQVMSREAFQNMVNQMCEDLPKPRKLSKIKRCAKFIKKIVALRGRFENYLNNVRAQQINSSN